MNTLCIVQCGGQKIWKKYPNIGHVKTKEAYTSLYFKKNRDYAERFGDDWMILSAKYGFLSPDDKIGDYNVTFKLKRSGPISYLELKNQVRNRGLDNYSTILVLGGKEYLDAVKAAFAGTSCIIQSPFEGLPIGQRMRAIDHALKGLIP